MNVERTCIFCSLLNKQLSLMGLFLCLSLISLGRYCIENVFKYVCVCVCVCVCVWGGGDSNRLLTMEKVNNNYGLKLLRTDKFRKLSCL